MSPVLKLSSAQRLCYWFVFRLWGQWSRVTIRTEFSLQHGCFLSCSGIEWTDVKHRTFTGTIISLSWSAGNMALALLAYFIRDWRHLTLAVMAPCIAAIVSWW